MSNTTLLENAIEGAYREQLWKAAARYFENCIANFAMNGNPERFAEEAARFDLCINLIDTAHSELKKKRGQT